MLRCQKKYCTVLADDFFDEKNKSLTKPIKIGTALNVMTSDGNSKWWWVGVCLFVRLFM